MPRLQRPNFLFYAEQTGNEILNLRAESGDQFTFRFAGGWRGAGSAQRKRQLFRQPGHKSGIQLFKSGDGMEIGKGEGVGEGQSHDVQL